MLNYIIAGLLIIVGLINFVPVVGVLSAARLEALYGLTFSESNLLILMRHRALMFGIVGGFIIYAAFRPQLQPAAFVIGFLSMAGFILIAWQEGGYNDLVKKVAIIDIFACVVLLIAVVLFFVRRSS